MINQGKTGVIHGINVKARVTVQQPSVDILTQSPEGRKAIMEAAKSAFERHYDVIKALANR